jgi:diaminopimelate decarboxylase
MTSSPATFPAHRGGELHAEQVPLTEIARRFGTPCYVYSRAALTQAYAEFETAFRGRDTLVCYAMKANSNLAILGLFASLGAGFDIVSGGELNRVLAAGGDPRKVIFSGVGKTEAEMRLALTHDILCFNVESRAELLRLNAVASVAGKRARVSLRVNPDVDAKTHPYIATGLKENKFGVAYDSAIALYLEASAMPNMEITGIDCHIGSQIPDTAPFADALDKVLALVDALEARGIRLEHVDMGGGAGIRYRDETPLSIDRYADVLTRRLAGRPQRLIVEPGRRLVGNAGLLLTRVEYLKEGGEKRFAIVDAAMNDLIRPALYDAYHEILPVHPRAEARAHYDIVGPVCESADFLARDRELALVPGDLLAVLSTGAYGSVMSSNYNTRPRAAEIMVDGSMCHLVRERESTEQLFAGEHLLP